MTQGLSLSLKSFKKLYELAFSTEVYENIQKTEDFTEDELKIVNQYKSFNQFLTSFVDDVNIYSVNHEHHLVHLKIYFYALKKANLKISKAKTQLATKNIKIFNHMYNSENSELAMNEQKVSAILNWSRPSSLYELNSRLCIMSYFSNFIPKLKAAMYPLIQILRCKHFSWEQLHEDAWTLCLNMIKCDTRLTIPKAGEEIYIYCDASKYAISGVLMVKRNEHLKIASCYSKLLSKTDFYKSAVQKEMIALIATLKHFQRYMENSSLSYIFTDARGILKSKRSMECSIKDFNFTNYLQQLAQTTNFKIYHVNGTYNILSDHFSRAILKSRFTTEDQKAFAKELSKVDPEISIKPFFIDSEILYNYITAPLKIPEDVKLNFKQKKQSVSRPLSQLINLIDSVSPEEKYLSAIKLLEETDSPLLKSLKMGDFVKDKNVQINAYNL